MTELMNVTPTIQSVSFLGGEAFCYFNELVQPMARANYLGYDISLLTNAFWAISDERVKACLSLLKNAGLKQIQLSWDLYHERFSVFDNNRRIIDWCRSNDIEVSVRSCANIIDQYSHLGEYSKYFDYSAVYPIGRGNADEYQTLDTLIRSCKYDCHCRAAKYDLWAWPGGYFSTCAWLNPRMIFKQNGQSLTKQLVEDPAYSFIKTNGPKGLLELITREKPRLLNTLDSQLYIDCCEFCRRALPLVFPRKGFVIPFYLKV